MNMEKALVYSEELELIGYLGEINYLEETAILLDENGDRHHISLKNKTTVLHKVGETKDGQSIYNQDIFKSTISGNLYELVDVGGGKLQFYQVGDGWVREEEVDTFLTSDFLDVLSKGKAYEFVGNRFELIGQEMDESDFDVELVKKSDADGVEHYYYAFNNVKEGVVDLLAVVFLGDVMFDAGNYHRITMEYEEMNERLTAGTLNVVTPEELRAYILGKLEDSEEDACENCDCKEGEACSNETKAPADFEADNEEGEDCFDCGEPAENCDCELW